MRAPFSAIFLTTASPSPVPLDFGGDVGFEGALEHLLGKAGAVVDDARRTLRRSWPFSVTLSVVRTTTPPSRSAMASSAFCTRLWMT